MARNYNAPPDLRTLLSDLQKRLRAVETAPQLSESSIEAGAIIENDIYGNAASQYGEQFDGTHTSASLTGPTPPTPTQPTVTGVLGGINVDWDGDFSLGELTPMDFSRVEIHVADTSGFIMAGSTLKATIETPQGGTQFISLPDTDTYYVCLVTRTQSGKFSPLSLEASATPTAPVTDPIVPALVTGLGGSASWHYDNTWMPALQATLSWSPVTLDEDGDPITVSGYEVWISVDNTNWSLLREVGGATTSYVATNLSLSSTYWFKVRALHESPGPFSSSVSIAGSSVTVTETVPNPPAPTASSRFSTIYANYTPPVSVAGQVRQAEIGIKTSAGGTYSVIGVIADPMKASVVTSTRSEATGTQFWIGARYVTQAGTSGTWVDASTNPTALVTVVDTDLVNTTIYSSLASLNSAVTGAQASANGKNKVNYNTVAPTSASPGIPGDIWWVRSGNTITDQYLNTAGTGTTSGNTWTAQTLTNATISTLDAAKITTGTLNAARIGAKTITADKVVIASTENLIPNGMFENGDRTLWHTSLVWNTTDTPPGLSGSLTTVAGQGTLAAHNTTIDTGGFPVEQDVEYLFELWVKASVPNSRLYVEVRDQATNHAATWEPVDGETNGGYTTSSQYPVQNYVVPTTWTRVVARGIFNAGASRAQLGNWFFNHANGSAQNAVVYVGGVRILRRVDSKLIVDGAITSRTVAAETIQGYHVAANSIEAGHITAGAVDVDKLRVGAAVGLNLMPNPGFETSGDFRFSPYRDSVLSGENSIDYQPITGMTVTVQRISSWSNGATGVNPYAGGFFLEMLGTGSTASFYGLQSADIICVGVEAIRGQSFRFSGKIAAYDHSDGTLVPAQQNANNNLDIDYIEVELRVYSTEGSEDESIVFTDTKRLHLDSFGDDLATLSAWQTLDQTVTIPEAYSNVRAELVVRAAVNSYGRAIALDEISITPITSGVLIADGAIKAEKIDVGAITADKLTSDAIDGKIITGAVFRTSSDVGVSNFTTAWTGTANNSTSTISGPGIVTRTNIARDPAGKTQSIWVQTDGATAVQAGNLLGRGGSVQSVSSMLTLPLNTVSVGSLPLAVTAQGWGVSSGGYTAYVHEAGTSLDGTLFTQAAVRPAGVPAGNVFDIGKDGRFYWVPASAGTASHKIYSSTKTGTSVTNQTATGYPARYAGRVLSPITSAAFIVNNYGEPAGRFESQVDVSVIRAGAASKATVNTTNLNAERGFYVRTNQSLYLLWNEITETVPPGGFITRNEVDFYMTKITSTGTTPVDGLLFNTFVRDSFLPPVLYGVKASVDNAVYIKVNNTGTINSFVYYKVTDSGTMTSVTAAVYNDVEDVSYPDDLNGAATTFTYSTADSQLKGSLVTKTDAQQRYIEANSQAVWTYNKTRAKHSVQLGTAAPDPNGWLRWFAEPRDWSAIPNPVLTFRVSAPMSSFLVEHSTELGFWFSGDAADAGSGAGGIMDSDGLRGYSPSGTLSTEIDFSTGVLTALGADISGRLEASNIAGSKYVRLLDGIATFVSETVTRGTIEGTTAGLTINSAGGNVTIGNSASVVTVGGVALNNVEISFSPYVIDGFTVSSGSIQRFGKQVVIKATVSGTFPTGLVALVNADGIPAAYRPSSVGNAWGPCYLGTGFDGTIVARPDGSISVHNTSGGSRSTLQFTLVYFTD